MKQSQEQGMTAVGGKTEGMPGGSLGKNPPSPASAGEMQF